MKKLLVSLMFCLTVLFSTSNTYALSPIDPYLNMLNDLNKEYNTSFTILSNKEYDIGNYKILLNKSYEEYITTILNTDINDLKEECIRSIELNKIDITVPPNNARSSIAKRSIKFNNNQNIMTITYRYNTSTFDTSYKPSVTVSKVSNLNYFIMDSYTGRFINSNRTYSIYTKGRIITTSGVLNSKSFTVNLNL